MIAFVDEVPERWLWAAGIVVAFALARLVLGRAARFFDARKHPLGSAFRATRNLFVPTTCLYFVVREVVLVEVDSTLLRVLETLLWITAIHASLSMVNALFFGGQQETSWRAEIPKLFLDITRFILVVIGTAIVFSAVWGADLSGLLAALGVGSIVIGLALQDTLGNLMAGIALLFERPFAIGDWIKVGDVRGKVLEMNWRAVHIRTRQRELIVVPNSTLGQETIVNQSRPTKIHIEEVQIGFSYDDPPNRVKRLLKRTALQTRGVLADPEPRVQTVNYNDFSIDYRIELPMADVAERERIKDEFFTQVWYVAKRNHLTIPFPIRTVFKTELPPPPPPRAGAERFAKTLQNIPVFIPLASEELDILADGADTEHFGAGERIVHQGTEGDALYVIREGTAVVSVNMEGGGEREVARLSRGEFFGEMALLTGEPRSAHVTAQDDLEVIVIRAPTLKALLARRPALAEEIAEIVEARKEGLRAVKELAALPNETRQAVQSRATVLVSRIRHFLGL